MGKAGEKQKRTPKTKDKRQYERFVETARELGCDESEEAFEREFVKIVPHEPSLIVCRKRPLPPRRGDYRSCAPHFISNILKRFFIPYEL